MASLRLFVGTFSGAVASFEINFSDGGNFEQMFASTIHKGAVKKIAGLYPFVVSGGTDESMRILNVKTKREFGSLEQHLGTVTNLQFFSESRSKRWLFSSAEDGKLCFWSMSNNWELMKEIVAHRGGVTDFAVHPSGKILVSTGKDQRLKVFDLSQGKCVIEQKLPKPASAVCWAKEGEVYAVCREKKVLVYDLEGEIVDLRKFRFAPSCLCPFGEKYMLVGDAEGALHVFEIGGSDAVLSLHGVHTRRVRALVKPPSLKDTGEPPYLIIISLDSSGRICVWSQLSILEAMEEKIKEVALVNENKSSEEKAEDNGSEKTVECDSEKKGKGDSEKKGEGVSEKSEQGDSVELLPDTFPPSPVKPVFQIETEAHLTCATLLNFPLSPNPAAEKENNDPLAANEGRSVGEAENKSSEVANKKGNKKRGKPKGNGNKKRKQDGKNGKSKNGKSNKKRKGSSD